MMRLNKFSVTSFLLGAVFTLTVSGVDAALKGSAIFRDVPAGHYADQAIGDAFAAKVITGYDSTHVGPDDPVTRGQLMLILSRLRLFPTTNPANPTPLPPPPPPSSSSSVSSSTESSSSVAYTPNGQMRFDSASYNQDENASSKLVNIVVVRTGGNQGTVTVQYSFSGGTAVIGNDYTPANGTLTFNNKQTSQKLTLTIADDTVADGNKTILMKLFNPTNGAVLGTPSTATINLIDNETTQTSSSSGAAGSSASSVASTSTRVALSATVYSTMENAGTQTITVNRTGVTTGVTAVNYGTADGTAKSGSDYTATSGTLTFAANETSKSFTVSVADNNSVEGNRNFNINLSNPTNGALLDTPGGTAPVTIVDNEAITSGSGSFKFSSANFSVTKSGGRAVITVMHVGGTGPVSVAYATNGGTALQGTDYTAVTGTLSFAQGETSKVFFVPVFSTNTAGGKTVNLTLNTPSNGLTFIDPSAATLTINE
jgi:Calx-beta domain/S-layer homology domain